MFLFLTVFGVYERDQWHEMSELRKPEPEVMPSTIFYIKAPSDNRHFVSPL